MIPAKTVVPGLALAVGLLGGCGGDGGGGTPSPGRPDNAAQAAHSAGTAETAAIAGLWDFTAAGGTVVITTIESIDGIDAFELEDVEYRLITADGVYYEYDYRGDGEAAYFEESENCFSLRGPFSLEVDPDPPLEGEDGWYVNRQFDAYDNEYEFRMNAIVVDGALRFRFEGDGADEAVDLPRLDGIAVDDLELCDEP